MSHLCHAIDCNLPVPPRLLMCRRHWYMVPKDIRDKVWAHYRPGQERDKRPSRLYVVVATAAICAVAIEEGKMDLDEATRRMERLRTKEGGDV